MDISGRIELGNESATVRNMVHDQLGKGPKRDSMGLPLPMLPSPGRLSVPSPDSRQNLAQLKEPIMKLLTM